MDGVYCCETCPDEETNTSNISNIVDGDKKDETAVKDISSDSNVSLGSNNQLTTAIEKTEQLVSSRKESLVGIRKMMFENIANKRDVSELTDDDKVVIKTTKRSLADDKFNDNGDKSVNRESFIKSDKLISSNSVDSNLELKINSLSDSNLRAGDDISVKSIFVNSEQVTNKLSDVISDKNNIISDLPFIDRFENSRDDSKVTNAIEDNICENDKGAFEKPPQGVVLISNELNSEESLKSEELKLRRSEEVVEKNEELDNQDTYLEMKSLSTDNIISEEEIEPIYEEIVENKSFDVKFINENSEDVDLKNNDFVNSSNEESKINVDISIQNKEIVDELTLDEETREDNTELKEVEKIDDVQNTLSLMNQTKPAILVLENESHENVETVEEIKEDNGKYRESFDYPSDLNPFGDEDDEVDCDEKNRTVSTNPFESDMEDDDDGMESKKMKGPTLAPLSATRRSNSYSENLNPFWSGSEEDEDENEKTSLLAPPIPLPRKLKSPQMSPTPIPRSSRHKITPSTGSGSSIGIAESPSPGKKKSVAPVPPSQNSTLKKRKPKPPPPPPPASTSRSPTPSISSDVSAPVTPTMREKIEKDSSNREKQITGGTFPRNKSTFGQWKRKKGQAPPPPLPQRRIVKPMPLKQVRQELADIEIKQQELERQGVSLEQTIRDKFDQESSMTPYVEELVLQLFELVNEKNELFRRQAELMYLRRQHNLEEEHAELEYQIRCLMLCPEHNKTDSDKEREEELIKRLVDVVERRNSIIQCLEMDRLREAEEDRSVSVQLGNFSAAIGSEIDLTSCDKKDKKHKKEKKKEKDSSTLDKDVDTVDKLLKYKKLKKKWFTLQHQRKH